MKALALPLFLFLVGCNAPASIPAPEDAEPIRFTPKQLHEQQKRVAGLTVEVTGFVRYAEGNHCSIRDDAEPLPIIDVHFAKDEAVQANQRITVRGRAGRAGTERNIMDAKITRR